MKNYNKKYLVIAFIAILFAGCSPGFLDVEPAGGVVSDNQFYSNPESGEALVRGLYSLMIATHASRHDYFGQKTIDIKTDMTIGDIALIAYNYGWFQDTEQLQDYGSSFFSSYMWSYFYSIIKNTNLIIKDTTGVNIPVTKQDSIRSYYVGQAYAMRGYAYNNLAYFYTRTFKGGGEVPCVPIYLADEASVNPQPQSKVSDVLDRAIRDLEIAKIYVKRYESLKDYTRRSKTDINSDVVNLLLANAYLYRASQFPDNMRTGITTMNGITVIDDARVAMDLCEEVITSGKYPILPLSNLLTTGFNSVSSENWMWGMDITPETTGALQSFWGHMDIFTYSYPFVGDIKAIDQNLYDEIKSHTTSIGGGKIKGDQRLNWWTIENKLAPTNKFFDKGRKRGGDRNWLNDIVFLRSEEAYLLAAEAAYKAGEELKAAQYLKLLLDQRNDDDPSYVLGKTGPELEKEIIYNWRVEMWGEGKAYQAFKRLNWKIVRGSNHKYKPNTTPDPYQIEYSIPYSETYYNPYISGQYQFENN